jgi:hypothetical protein
MEPKWRFLERSSKRGFTTSVYWKVARSKLLKMRHFDLTMPHLDVTMWYMCLIMRYKYGILVGK